MNKIINGLLIAAALQGLYYLFGPQTNQPPPRELTSLATEAIKDTDKMFQEIVVRGKQSSRDEAPVAPKPDSKPDPENPLDETTGPPAENAETKLLKSAPKNSGKSLEAPKAEPFSKAVIEFKEKPTSTGKLNESSGPPPMEMPKSEAPPQAPLVVPPEMLASKRKISDLFSYIRADRVVLKASVQTVDGALKLLEIAHRVWKKEKIEFAVDWTLNQAEQKIEGDGCLAEKAANKFVVEAVTQQNLNSCIYIGQVEAVSSANPTLKEKTVNRIYFTSGPEFTESFLALSQPYRHKLAFFDRYLRKDDEN